MSGSKASVIQDPLRWMDFVVYLALGAFVVATGTRDALWVVGLALSAACAIPWFLARVQLGRSFSVGAEARALVTHGIYSRIRHPVYVFGTTAFMFALLGLLGWRALVVWAIVLPIQVMRARREESVLAAAFGRGYEEYRSTTWL